jgi:hypothetical protein
MKTKSTYSAIVIFLIIVVATVASAQPTIDGLKVYYGSLHNHSNVSDGQGTPDAAYNYAKNIAHLDFFGLADHSNLMDATEWLLIKNTANIYNEDDVFAAFYGFEWTTYFSYGHVTVVNTEDYCSTGSPTNTFNGLMNWLNARNGIAFFNHPGWDPFAFNEFDHFNGVPSSKFVGMELWNDHDGFSKYYYNDGYYSGDGNKGYFDEALIRHWKVGAAGGDDNHTASWGTATPFRMGVLASTINRTEIFNALIARRFFSTVDKNLVLSFKINGYDMGSTILGGTWNSVIQAFDVDNEIITNVDLLKNGVVIQSWTPGIIHPNIANTIICADGDYFYARIKEADGDEAISSPIFISGIAQPPQIAITGPVNGAVFTAGVDVSINASASDIDGTITNVEFYRDNYLIGQDNFPPYVVVWPDVPAGSFTLAAKAYDNTGLVTTSGGVTIIVEPPPPVLSVIPPNRNVIYASGNTFFSVESNTSWTNMSNQEWCTVTPSGLGDGTLLAEFGENTTTAMRVAEITVTTTGLPPIIVTVTQEGIANKILNISLLLQALYDESGTMDPAMDESGAHWGTTIADKITIELHDAIDYSNVVFSLSDVDLHTDGIASVTLPYIYDGNYYITLKHRNSIETVSAAPISFWGELIAYSFNTNAQVYGNNLVMMPDGWWAVFGADINQDGIVDSGDMIFVDNDSNNYLSGYLISDTNGDGIIDSGDMMIVDNNASNYVACIHP